MRATTRGLAASRLGLVLLALCSPPAASQVPGLDTLRGNISDSVGREQSYQQSGSIYGRLVKPTLTINATRGELRAASYQPSNGLLLQLFTDGKLLVWDFNRGGQIDELSLPPATLPVHYDAAGGRLYALARSSLVRIRRAAGSARAGESLLEGATAVSVSGDGRWLLAGTSAGEVVKLNLDGRPAWRRKVLAAAVREIAVNLDGRHITVLGSGGDAALLDESSASPVNVQGVKHLVGYDRGGRSVRLLTDRGVLSAPLTGGQPTLAASIGGLDAIAMNTAGDRYVAITNGRLAVVEGGGLKSVDDGVRYAAFLDAKRYVYAKGNGVMHLRSLDLGYYLLAIVPSPTGWAVVDHEGRYDGTVAGSKDLVWRSDNEVMTLDQFFDQYFQPGLLAAYVKDQERALAPPPRDIKQGVFPPPKVDLDFPQKTMQAGKEFRVVAVSESRGGELREEIKLFYNGKRLPPKGRLGAQTVRKGNRLLHVEVFGFTPIAGLNEIYAEASNLHGVAGRSEIRKMTAEGTRPPGRLHIVGIGVNKYQQSHLNLDYAVNDVSALVERIERGAREMYAGVIQRSVFDERATRKGVLEALASLREAAAQDSVVVIMAGHGDNEGGEWYFIPHDVDLKAIGASSVSAREIQDALVASTAGSIFLIVDACHSGAGVDDFNRYRNFQRRFAQQMGRSAGVAVLMAARRDQFAFESKTIGHGLFTDTVLRGLDGAADVLPKDSRVSAHELASYVAANLRERSIELNSGQRNLQVQEPSAPAPQPAADAEPPLIQEPAHFVIGADFLVSEVRRAVSR